jgi:hypothetical protein
VLKSTIRIGVIVAGVNYNSASAFENYKLCKILRLKPISYFTIPFK